MTILTTYILKSSEEDAECMYSCTYDICVHTCIYACMGMHVGIYECMHSVYNDVGQSPIIRYEFEGVGEEGPLAQGEGRKSTCHLLRSMKAWPLNHKFEFQHPKTSEWRPKRPWWYTNACNHPSFGSQRKNSSNQSRYSRAGMLKAADNVPYARSRWDSNRSVLLR